MLSMILPFASQKMILLRLPIRLHDQGFLTQVAHLVQVLDLEVDDALHVWLADLHDPSVCDMLAQKHAEIRRGERTRFVGAGQI